MDGYLDNVGGDLLVVLAVAANELVEVNVHVVEDEIENGMPLLVLDLLPDRRHQDPPLGHHHRRYVTGLIVDIHHTDGPLGLYRGLRRERSQR